MAHVPADSFSSRKTPSRHADQGMRMLRLTAAALTVALAWPAHATGDTSAGTDGKPKDLLVEIQGHFPSARKWFQMVSDLEWDRAADGSLSPRLETLHSRFVIVRDRAGQSLMARIPAVAGGPLAVWVAGSRTFSVRTEEVGTEAVQAEVLRGMIVYRGAVAGGDLLYKLTPTHVDEYIYFREPPPSLTREFQFDYGSAVGSLRDNGEFVEVLGKDGVARLRLSAPLARAADGTRRRGTVRLRGRTLVEELDLRGLKAPVLVDPDWSTTGSMTTAHWGDAAFRRADNRVMVVGGCALAGCPGSFTDVFCAQVLAAADVWDEARGTWTTGQPMQTGRYTYASVTLPGGDFLVAGGCTATGCTSTTALAERYSSANDSWTPAGALTGPRANGAAELLPGGDALVVGGCDPTTGQCSADAQRYQNSMGTFTGVAPMPTPRGFATATALADGTVLLVGGCSDPLCATMLNTALRYDPGTDAWASAGTMATTRAAHTATLLPDGNVLVVGGCQDGTCQSTLNSAVLWSMDAGGGSFISLPPMHGARHNHTATLLNNGSVLIAGGLSASNATTPMAEVYLPLAGYWWDTTGMLMDRAYHVAVPLQSGNVLVGGGCNPATCMPWAEVFAGETVPPNVDGGTPPEHPDAGAATGDAGPPRVYTAESPHPPLYRTGVTQCATNDVQDLTCPLPGYGLQDGQFQPNQRTFEAQGEEVLDPVTGLRWQANDDGNTYTQAEAVGHCAAFSTPTTPAGVWRLPSVVELLTINSYGSTEPSMSPLFVGAQSTNYWTATVIPVAIRLAWTVKFDFGEVIPVLIDSPLPVRCVHGPPITTGSSGVRLAGAFTTTPQTVVDTRTGLEWQRQDDGVKRTWRDSLEYCANLNLAGKTGWHLPNIFELVGLVEFVHDLFTTAIDPAFVQPHSDIYWSATYNEGVPTLSLGVTFNLGVVDGVTISGHGYARCVRHLAVPVVDGGVQDSGPSAVDGSMPDAALPDGGAVADAASSGAQPATPPRCGCTSGSDDAGRPWAVLALCTAWLAALRRRAGRVKRG